VKAEGPGSSSERLVVRPLARRERLGDFDCGQPALNAYLHRQASQDVRRDIGRVFVATVPPADDVVGYYTLSALSLPKADLPADTARRLPHYPVPAALLGRLAVDRSLHGRGIGSHLLIDAMVRVLAASRQVALYALVVDAKDDKAGAFYARHGFVAFPGLPARRFLPLGTIRAALGER